MSRESMRLAVANVKYVNLPSYVRSGQMIAQELDGTLLALHILGEEVDDPTCPRPIAVQRLQIIRCQG